MKAPFKGMIRVTKVSAKAVDILRRAGYLVVLVQEVRQYGLIDDSYISTFVWNLDSRSSSTWINDLGTACAHDCTRVHGHSILNPLPLGSASPGILEAFFLELLWQDQKFMDITVRNALPRIIHGEP